MQWAYLQARLYMPAQKTTANSAVTLEDFYNQQIVEKPKNLNLNEPHIHIFRLDKNAPPGHRAPAKYTRRDFYKIGLIQGRTRFHYADKSIETSGYTLIFFSSLVPYTWEALQTDCSSETCLFNEAFFTSHLNTNLREMPMFMPGNKPSYELTAAQYKELENIFEKMRANLASDYRLKYDLVRNYILEIVHFALKLEPAELAYRHSNANARITSVFIDLLERQFPIELPHEQFSLRQPRDFAGRLAVHVNHLNRAIKETTGKTTTRLIAERVVAEAKALLRHTSFNISEISYALGFEDMAHFDNFFKKQTATTPSAYRTAG